jgi:hypothetical protein
LRNRLREPIDGSRFLGLRNHAFIDTVLRQALFAPLRSFTEGRGKEIRGQIVTLGCELLDCSDDLGSDLRIKCKLAAEAIECIHSRTLIIDDIETEASSADDDHVCTSNMAFLLRLTQGIGFISGGINL